MESLLKRVVARALGSDPPQAKGVRLRQRGSIRLQPDAPWCPFEATQIISSTTPRFRWDARIRYRPLLTMHVVDAFEEGHGRLDVRLLRWIRVASATGPEVDRGELLRYLAELPWCPHALRDNPELTFRATDGEHLEVAASGQSLRLTVDEAGDVVEAFAERRPRMVGSTFVESPWQGRFSEHRMLGGIRVPTHATVTWHLDDGPFECFRAAIVDCELLPRPTGPNATPARPGSRTPPRRA